MKKRITLKEIAEMAGVSTATVSKVLNNNGRYSEETKRKVLSIAEEYNYRPNVVAQSLRTSRSSTIGVIVPDITNEFFAQLVLAIETYCDQKGYSVFICNSNENEKKELQYFIDLENKGVDGLIYLSGRDILLENKSLPIVCIDRKPNNRNVVIVASDNEHGGYMAGQELFSKGCKNVLLIRDHRNVASSDERSEGFMKAAEEFGIQLEEENVLRIQVSLDEAKEMVSKLIDEDRFHFDGIFATTDAMALGALLALDEANYRIPEDVKIVGFDNVSLSKYTSITTIHQNTSLMGEIAASLLLDMIENKPDIIENEMITIPVELIQRKSTEMM